MRVFVAIFVIALVGQALAKPAGGSGNGAERSCRDWQCDYGKAAWNNNLKLCVCPPKPTEPSSPPTVPEEQPSSPSVPPAPEGPAPEEPVEGDVEQEDNKSETEGPVEPPATGSPEVEPVDDQEDNKSASPEPESQPEPSPVPPVQEEGEGDEPEGSGSGSGSPEPELEPV